MEKYFRTIKVQKGPESNYLYDFFFWRVLTIIG